MSHVAINFYIDFVFDIVVCRFTAELPIILTEPIFSPTSILLYIRNISRKWCNLIWFLLESFSAEFLMKFLNPILFTFLCSVCKQIWIKEKRLFCHFLAQLNVRGGKHRIKMYYIIVLIFVKDNITTNLHLIFFFTCLLF